MKEIVLKFDKSRSTVSGNDYGRNVFEQQVAPFHNEDEAICVVFPDTIELVSMSFAQGFIHDIAEKYGLKNTGKILKFKSTQKRVVDRFLEAIEHYD